MKKTLWVVLAIGMLAGCATQWNKAGVTDETWRKDYDECRSGCLPEADGSRERSGGSLEKNPGTGNVNAFLMHQCMSRCLEARGYTLEWAEQDNASPNRQ